MPRCHAPWNRAPTLSSRRSVATRQRKSPSVVCSAGESPRKPPRPPQAARPAARRRPRLRWRSRCRCSLRWSSCTRRPSHRAQRQNTSGTTQRGAPVEGLAALRAHFQIPFHWPGLAGAWVGRLVFHDTFRGLRSITNGVYSVQSIIYILWRLPACSFRTLGWRI